MTSLMETAQDRRTSSDDAKKSKGEQLATHGLSVQEAHRYEALAAMPAEHFETAAAEVRNHCVQAGSTFASTAAFIRSATPKTWAKSSFILAASSGLAVT